mgnify:FL=1
MKRCPSTPSDRGSSPKSRHVFFFCLSQKSQPEGVGVGVLNTMQFLRSVAATRKDAAMHVVETELTRALRESVDPAYAGQRQLAKLSRGVEPLDTAASLRIGGAQVLTSASGLVLNQSDTNRSLHFARTALRESGLCLSMCQALRRMNIHKLTPLQGALVPLILRGRNVIAHSETGSGKSFGVALACCNRIARDNITYRLHTLILVPTDELAIQYDGWLRYFSGDARQVCLAATTTDSLESQLVQLHNVQPHVLVGTPQRIADISRHAKDVVRKPLRATLDLIVIDEADAILRRRVEMGRGSPAISCAELVDRLFRSRAEEVPAHMVALSATMDGSTSQRINQWFKATNSAVRLTTSVLDHNVPEHLRFVWLPTTLTFSILMALELILRLIFHPATAASPSAGGLRHVKKKVLVFTNLDVQSVLTHIESCIGTTAASLLVGMERVDGSALPSESVVLDALPSSKADPAPASVHEAVASDAMLASSASSFADVKCAALIPSKSEVEAGVSGHQGNAQNRRRIDGHRYFRGYNRITGHQGNIFVDADTAIAKLNEGVFNVAVGNYSCARGLHIQGVTDVIVIGDQSPGAVDFLHCAGRCARMGAEGRVSVIFPPSCGRSYMSICQTMDIPWQLNRVSSVLELYSRLCRAQSEADSGKGRGEVTFDPAASVSPDWKAAAVADGEGSAAYTAGLLYHLRHDAAEEATEAAGSSGTATDVQPDATELFF